MQAKKSIDIEILVTQAITQLGFPANIKGYYYIRQAIMMAVENSGVLNSITNNLYPQIAEQHNTI